MAACFCDGVLAGQASCSSHVAQNTLYRICQPGAPRQTMYSSSNYAKQTPSGLVSLSRFASKPQQLLRSRRTSKIQRTSASLGTWLSTIQQVPVLLTTAASSIEQLPPACYGIYMLATSFGVPLSEDALVLWVGSNMFRGVYGSWLSSISMLGYVFALVVLSDMVTFWMGQALRSGMFAPLKQRLFSNSEWLDQASVSIAKWSMWIGLVQRFTLGFPLCLACGFLGVRTARFAGGVLAGSVLTLILQLGGAYLLKDRPALCLAAVAACNAFEVIAPAAVLAWVGFKRLLQRKHSSISSSRTATAQSLAPGSIAGVETRMAVSSPTAGLSSRPSGGVAGVPALNAVLPQEVAVAAVSNALPELHLAELTGCRLSGGSSSALSGAIPALAVQPCPLTAASSLQGGNIAM